MPHAHYPLVYGPLKPVLYPDYVVVGPGDEERPPRKSGACTDGTHSQCSGQMAGVVRGGQQHGKLIPCGCWCHP